MDISVIFQVLDKYSSSLILGVQNTLIVALLGTIIGLVIGLLIGGLKAIKLDTAAPLVIKILKKVYDIISTIYIEVFRGTPMMIQAVFIYYALLKIVGWTPLIAGVFIISINTGAYMSEITRSGIQSVDKGQNEAARSLGMSNIQSMLLVVMPQAIKNAFPSIGNEFIVNIKDSSVLSIITLTELAFQTNRVAGSTLKYTESYFVSACVYLALTICTSFVLHLIEKKMNNAKTSLPQSDTNKNSISIAVKKGTQWNQF